MPQLNNSNPWAYRRRAGWQDDVDADLRAHAHRPDRHAGWACDSGRDLWLREPLSPLVYCRSLARLCDNTAPGLTVVLQSMPIVLLRNGPRGHAAPAGRGPRHAPPNARPSHAPAPATQHLHGSRIGRHQPCSRRTECCSPRTYSCTAERVHMRAALHQLRGTAPLRAPRCAAARCAARRVAGNASQIGVYLLG